MSWFVIGVSGATCGGKTTLTQLLRRTFPGCRVLHQDKYFYPDNDSRHIRLPEAQNHVNYEILSALDMKRMHADVATILKSNGAGSKSKLPENDSLPNFEAYDLVKNAADIDLGDRLSQHKDVSILLLEGFILFASDFIYDSCDVRFFLKLDEKECKERRAQRTCYNPPDTPGYFELGIWKEYSKHFENFILKKEAGIHILNGNTNIIDLRNKTVSIILDALDKKFPIRK